MRLIADIGGTNARFALAGRDGVAELAVLPVADFPDFAPALKVFLDGLDGQAGGGEITEAAIAAAGPRDGEAVTLTNAPWRIDAGAVSSMLGGAPVRVLNDLEAVALGLPALSRTHSAPIAGAPADPPAGGVPRPMLAANIGTGFGAAVAVPLPGGGWAVLGAEPGHMSLTPATAGEERLLGPAHSVEQAFSGPGYARLFGASVRDGGETVQPVSNPDPARADAGAAGDDRRLYSRIFGRVLGDLVLATGAWGGVWLCGGVSADFERIFDVDEVMRAFRRKGKMAARMEHVPLSRITVDAPAFHSLATVPIR